MFGYKYDFGTPGGTNMSKSSTDETATEAALAHVDTNDRYRILSSEERQVVLETLEGTSSISLDALAAAVASRTQDDKTETQAKISLVHQHLPLLSDAGVVEYDREKKHVTTAESALEELLRLL